MSPRKNVISNLRKPAIWNPSWCQGKNLGHSKTQIKMEPFKEALNFRLVPQPNCVKVPKEICVNTKANPRRVKKPVVKEWCYKPSELAAAGGV